jgi:hypothetical protein
MNICSEDHRPRRSAYSPSHGSIPDLTSESRIDPRAATAHSRRTLS